MKQTKKEEQNIIEINNNSQEDNSMASDSITNNEELEYSSKKEIGMASVSITNDEELENSLKGEIEEIEFEEKQPELNSSSFRSCDRFKQIVFDIKNEYLNSPSTFFRRSSIFN